MGQRRRAREYALQMLFQLDLAGGLPEEAFPQFWASQEADPEVRSFAERLVRGVAGARGALDEVIGGSTEHWRLDRMATVDRNVLRLAVWEMLSEPDTPPAVVIDEAIEIGKRFGSERSGAFVNGVLDGIRRRIERGEVPPWRAAP